MVGIIDFYSTFLCSYCTSAESGNCPHLFLLSTFLVGTVHSIYSPAACSVSFLLPRKFQISRHTDVHPLPTLSTPLCRHLNCTKNPVNPFAAPCSFTSLTTSQSTMSPTDRHGRPAGINDDLQAPLTHRRRSASPRQETDQGRNRDELRSQLPSLNTALNGPAPATRAPVTQAPSIRAPATQAQQSLAEYAGTRGSPPPSKTMMGTWRFQTGEWQARKAAEREEAERYEREEREERRERRRAKERKRQQAEERERQRANDLQRHRNTATQAISAYPSDANQFTRPLLEDATAGQRPLNDRLDDPFVDSGEIRPGAPRSFVPFNIGRDGDPGRSHGDLHTLRPSVDFTTPTGQRYVGQAGQQQEREDTLDSDDIDYGSDPDPEDDESDHPRPGFASKSRRVGNLPVNNVDPGTADVNPGVVRRTIERGRDPIHALAAQQEDHDRSTRRLRNELIQANNDVRSLQQQLRNSNDYRDLLENAVATLGSNPTKVGFREAGVTQVQVERIQQLEREVADQRRRAENAEGDGQQRLNALDTRNAEIREHNQLIYDQARHIRRQAEEIAELREYARLSPVVNVARPQNQPQEPRRQQPQRPPPRRNTQGTRSRQPRREPRQAGPRQPQPDAQPVRPPPAGERRQPARAAKGKVKSYAPSGR